MTDKQGECALRQLHWCLGTDIGEPRIRELIAMRALNVKEASDLIGALIAISRPNTYSEEERADARTYIANLLLKYS